MPDRTRRPGLPLEERLWRYLTGELRRLGAGDATEDIAAEVMAKYARYRPEFYKKWLERTMRTTLADHWRRHRSHLPLPSPSLTSDPDAGRAGPLPPDLLVSSLSTPAADRDVARRLLAALTPAQRAVVVARFWEGLPSKEIAERLGYNSAAVVDTILDRAGRRLRDRFPAGLDAIR